jgi:hypothetical protein
MQGNGESWKEAGDVVVREHPRYAPVTVEVISDRNVNSLRVKITTPSLSKRCSSRMPAVVVSQMMMTWWVASVVLSRIEAVSVSRG